MKNPIVLITSTQGSLNITSPAVKAAGYFGYNTGTSTICWSMDNLTGRVYVDGSLATNPGDNDWFSINIGGLQPYVQYPINPLNPTGTTGDTGLDVYTFQGILTWIRIRLDRTYLINPSLSSIGTLQNALLNY